MHLPKSHVLAVAFVTAFTAVITVNAEQDPPRYWDFNGDGKEDIRYEEVESDLSYLEYSDRNFDGKDDQYTQYDSNSDWPVGGFSDDNFDGTFETRHVYKDASIYAILTDSDGDNHYDIAHYYETGLVTKSLKYTANGGKQVLTTFIYEFDFPTNEIQVETSKSPSEFHQYLISTMPQEQNMPLKRSN